MHTMTRVGAVVVAALLWAGLATVAIATAAPAEQPVRESIDQSPAEVREAWTKERLLEAQSVSPPGAFDPPVAPQPRSAPVLPEPEVPGELRPQPLNVAGNDTHIRNTTRYPARVHGKVFFIVPGVGESSCSGTVVGSRGRNLIYTAAHCIFDRETGLWSEQVVFIPGYDNGKTPFGVFPAADLWALNAYTDLSLGLSFIESNSFDIGVIVTAQPVQNRVGARGVAFDRPREQRFSIFGYPSRPGPPYDGERLINCRQAEFLASEDQIPGFPPTADPPVNAAGPCFMQQGSSGGGWVIRNRFVNSVVSWGLCDNDPNFCGVIHGPYFGQGARALYQAAGGGDRKPADSVPCRKAKRKLTRSAKRFRQARRAHRRLQSNRSANRLRKAKRQRNAARKATRNRGC